MITAGHAWRYMMHWHSDLVAQVTGLHGTWRLCKSVPSTVGLTANPSVDLTLAAIDLCTIDSRPQHPLSALDKAAATCLFASSMTTAAAAADDLGAVVGIQLC